MGFAATKPVVRKRGATTSVFAPNAVAHSNQKRDTNAIVTIASQEQANHETNHNPVQTGHNDDGRSPMQQGQG